MAARTWSLLQPSFANTRAMLGPSMGNLIFAIALTATLLTLFILPVLFVITLVPGILSVLHDLRMGLGPPR